MRFTRWLGPFAGPEDLTAANVSRYHVYLVAGGRASATVKKDRAALNTFLRWLAEHEHRLPDEAQVLVTDATARPDFVYRHADGEVAVFVDGPHHDAAGVAERDRAAEDRLVDIGWSVVRVRYDHDWAATVSRYPSVFGQGKDVTA